ncbi:MAG: outer membrane protein [Pseudomonadota bacterium]
MHRNDRRKLVAALLTGCALAGYSGDAEAADLRVKAPVAVPVYSWTGFYLGAHAGYGWRNPTVAFTANDPAAFAISCGGNNGSTCVPPASFRGDGVLGGLQAGYNWQFNQSGVIGAEADFAWTSMGGEATSTFLMQPLLFPPGTSTFRASEDVKWFGTVRGRLGWLPTSQLLIYGTAGFAYGRVDEDLNLNGQAGSNFVQGGFVHNCGNPAAAPRCYVGSSSRIATGWAAGAGLEHALGNNVSLKAEYLYVNLGNVATSAAVSALLVGPNQTAASFTASHREDFHVARVGVNYRFGGPVVARY